MHVYTCKICKNFTEHVCHRVRRSDKHCAGLWSDSIIEQVIMRVLKNQRGLTIWRGVTESARLLWVRSIHRADIHNCMCNYNTKAVSSI